MLLAIDYYKNVNSYFFSSSVENSNDLNFAC